MVNKTYNISLALRCHNYEMYISVLNYYAGNIDLPLHIHFHSIANTLPLGGSKTDNAMLPLQADHSGVLQLVEYENKT